jgi:hypothetical protein
MASAESRVARLSIFRAGVGSSLNETIAEQGQNGLNFGLHRTYTCVQPQVRIFRRLVVVIDSDDVADLTPAGFRVQTLDVPELADVQRPGPRHGRRWRPGPAG